MSQDSISKKFGGHASRWLVALVLLPPVLYSIFAENMIFFFIIMTLIGGLTWWEFSQKLFGAARTGFCAMSLTGWLMVAAGSFFYGPDGQQLGLLLALGLGAAYCLWALERQSGPTIVNLLSRYALGHLYISFLLSFLFLMRKLDNGSFWLLYVLLVTAAADTFAYYVGSKLHGPKLYPKASPNKTISGLVGGLVGAVIVSVASSGFLPSEAAPMKLAILGIILGLWGALGDLFESAIKRCLGVKDSSRLLMGHGGFLDRLDALMFNLPPVYIFVMWWVVNP